MRIIAFAFVFVVGCATPDTNAPLLGYPGYGSVPSGPGASEPGGPSVSEPAPYTVESLPPEPLYETMSPSPGDGWVWIDGYWHWDGYEWVWVGGRWEHQQAGYVYVQPNYEYGADNYVYTPGYWSLPTHVPSGWTVVRDHRNGRPVRATPPVRQPGSTGSVVVPPRVPGRSPPSSGWRPPVTNPGGIGTGTMRGPHRPRPIYDQPGGRTAPVNGGSLSRMPSGPIPSSEPARGGGGGGGGPPTSAPANPPTAGSPTVIFVPGPSSSSPPPNRPGRGGASSQPPGRSAPMQAPSRAEPPPVQAPSPPPVQAPPPQHTTPAPAPSRSSPSPGYRSAPSSDVPSRPATVPTQRPR